MIKQEQREPIRDLLPEQGLRHKKPGSRIMTGFSPPVGGGSRAEIVMSSNSRGDVVINQQLCKGCSLCTVACAPGVLAQSNFLNRQGYYAIAYTGSGCTGCGVCFYVCPEPGAITVRKRKDTPAPAAKPDTGAGDRDAAGN
jgi:2-oxoglutarate ferredoxin oxidoreductase subunit delta